MIEPSIGIALGSTFSRIGDVEYNLAQIADFAEQARRAGSHILLTPELSVTGYGPYVEVVALAEIPGEGAVYEGLAKIAKRSGVAIAAGFVEKHGHGPGISHYVVMPGGEFHVQRKYWVTAFEFPLVPVLESLPPGKPVPEALGFDVPDFPVFEIQGLKCVVVICADAGIENLHGYFDALSVQVVFAPVGAGGDVKDRVRTYDLDTAEGRAKYRGALEKAYWPPAKGIFDCITHRRALACINQTGWDGRKCAHIGDGNIVSPRGELPVMLCGVPNLDFQRPAFGAGSIPLSHF